MNRIRILALLLACTWVPAAVAAAPPALTSEQVQAIERMLTTPENAAAGRRWGDQFESAMRQRLGALAATGEARNLYVAARLLEPLEARNADGAQGQDDAMPAQAREWLQAALDARPRDPLVARFEIDACSDMGLRCAPDQALASLLAQEPDNAEVHLRALHAAQRRGDQVAVARHWQDAVRATRFDGGTRLFGRALLRAYSDLQWPLPDAALSRTIEQVRAQGLELEPRALAMLPAQQVWAAYALPPLGPLQQVSACKVARARTAHGDECMAVAGLLAADDSNLLVPQLGLKVLIALTTGTPDQQPWEQQLRQLQWQQSAPVEAMLGQTLSSAMYLQMETMLRDGELAALRQTLARNGLAAAPPADWRPGDGATIEAGGVLGVTLPAE